jgi:alkylation response protein AidB-like acyl-CoA dehydrogenase
MDITLSEEQRLLRESVDRFVTETYTPELRRSTASEPLGFNQGIWKQFADLGWLAMPIAEAYGGLSGGAIETGILMEAFGRGLATEPYLSTVVIGASLIGSCGSDARRQSLLPQIAEGALRLAFAHCERAARFELSRVDTTARRTAEGWRLDGSKIAVLDGGAADQIIVSARVRDADGSPGALSLFLVPAKAAGLSLQDYPRLGGGRACNLDLSDVRLPADARLGDDRDALGQIEAVVDRALAALGAEAVGITQTLLDRTIDYTRMRQQFGRPLSCTSFNCTRRIRRRHHRHHRNCCRRCSSSARRHGPTRRRYPTGRRRLRAPRREGVHDRAARATPAHGRPDRSAELLCLPASTWDVSPGRGRRTL